MTISFAWSGNRRVPLDHAQNVIPLDRAQNVILMGRAPNMILMDRAQNVILTDRVPNVILMDRAQNVAFAPLVESSSSRMQGKNLTICTITSAHTGHLLRSATFYLRILKNSR